jgi:membrane-associated phospholipid phosphatase
MERIFWRWPRSPRPGDHAADHRDPGPWAQRKPIVAVPIRTNACREGEQLRRIVPRPLVPAATRPLAVILLTVCVSVTVLLGVRFAHHTRAGWLDAVVDARIRADFGGHPQLLNQLAGLGDPIPVAAMTAALLLACLMARRWRGAVLVAVAVPAAAVLTEFALKPLVGRTLAGALSFPSGHATRVFALATAFAVLLAHPFHPRLPAFVPLLLALAGLLIASAIGAALVGVGAHYVTDTVGGAAVGTAVVLATALILDWLVPAS